jgi:hypothetical protein
MESHKIPWFQTTNQIREVQVSMLKAPPCSHGDSAKGDPPKKGFAIIHHPISYHEVPPYLPPYLSLRLGEIPSLNIIIL